MPVVVTHVGSGRLTLWLGVVLFQRYAPVASRYVAATWEVSALAVRLFLGMLSAVLALSLAGVIGEEYHRLIVWLPGRFVALAEFIDRKTPDGTIGLLGFVLVVVNFVLQVIGTWAGRHGDGANHIERNPASTV